MPSLASRFALCLLLVPACSDSGSSTMPPSPALPFAGTPACTPRTSFSATGFFRVDRDCDQPLLVDPDGKPFYSFGINHVRWDGDYAPSTGHNPYAEAVAARYGTEDAWAAASAQRMSDWGFNTVGSWSSYKSLGAHLPYTVMLTLSGADWQKGTIPDYFAADFETAVKMKAQAGTAGLTADRKLIGYFLDNELHWGPDWRTIADLFDAALVLDAKAAGKQALVKLLRDRHHEDVADFNAAWNTHLATLDELSATTSLAPRGTSQAADADRSAFIELTARRFFAVTTSAVRAADPNHLILGVRAVASMTPREVAIAAADYLDVMSVNAYEYTVNPQELFQPATYGFIDLAEGGFLESFYRLTGRPILVTEFGFRAADSGLPNTWPPFYPTLATQTERADRFADYAKRCLAAPYIVGYHWFEWADQPGEGRFDGENNNWGLVTLADNPYLDVTSRTQSTNCASFDARPACKK